ncbi:hypothetical protein CEUSTIGMA_g11151.t1 [Chlamydomonas eustigma]|uniref:RING-type domain-containing protein n=1 Tax=Chlamydomonas eustigma TaxID=1157962 RepID=A0A250XL21_9CHLO|nr:hypothetical protein CEUSTIGMA_g11151.t1 [Chlamydomonas eustigma]|eukprot:GAX83726.1 hypothetical protein CEUSTIGMA_g11151.t1 [Chlamydomonas eustigma]
MPRSEGAGLLRSCDAESTVSHTLLKVEERPCGASHSGSVAKLIVTGMMDAQGGILSNHDQLEGGSPSRSSMVQGSRLDAEPSIKGSELEACGVCMEGEVFATLKICGHSMCTDCAMEIVRRHAKQLIPCPFCRSWIQGFEATPSHIN